MVVAEAMVAGASMVPAHALLTGQRIFCWPPSSIGVRVAVRGMESSVIHWSPSRVFSLSTIVEAILGGRHQSRRFHPYLFPGGRAEQRQFDPRHSDAAPHAGAHCGTQRAPAHFGFQGRGRVFCTQHRELGSEGRGSVFGGVLHALGHNGAPQALWHRGGGEKGGGVGAEQYRGHATHVVGKSREFNTFCQRRR